MASYNQAPHLIDVFTPEQQAIIGQIVKTEISEVIASGCLVCSHYSSSSSSRSSSQLPWLPTDSKVTVPTAPLQAIDKQLTIFKRQLSEQVTKLQQFIDNHSCIRINTPNLKNNRVAANPSTSAKCVDKIAIVEHPKDLEYSCRKFENLSCDLDSNSKNVDFTCMLKDMHVSFESTMSKLHLAFEKTTNYQRKLEYTGCVVAKTEKLQSDIKNLTVLHSVTVDRHEVLRTLVSNIGHEPSELAEFVRQLSECTASADDVVELRAVVECMARVTGVSEHKAEQLITQFIGRESVELEYLKRELRLADDKIHELLLARDHMTNMHDSAYQTQLPYLNVVADTMQRECERYKCDLNAMAEKVSERVNAKVAQAIQQSLADQQKQNNKALFDLPSTKKQDTEPRLSASARSGDKILTELVQPFADNGSTLIQVVTTAAVENETEPKCHQVKHTEVKDTAISSSPSLAKMSAETSPSYSHLQREDQLSNSIETASVQHDTSLTHLSDSGSKALLNNLLRELRRIMSNRFNRLPVISCLVVADTNQLKLKRKSSNRLMLT